MHRIRQATLMAPAALLTLSAIASAGERMEVIFTEIPTSNTSLAPGALDASSMPVVARFIALEDLNVSPDGTAWVIKGRTDQPTTNDSILLLGAGTSGTMFLQDGQPFLGGQPGEQYDFFDTDNPVTWDDAGNIGFSARAKNGVSAVKEKLVFYDAVNQTHTVILTESTPALGLSDISTAITGDELIGNSIGSVFLRNDGKLGFINTPIQNCSSFRYPAFFIDDTGFLQSGVHMIGGEVWDSFSLSGAGGTTDGVHWFAIGDTEGATTADEILAVDGVVVIREGSPVAGSAIIADDTFQCRMANNGFWYARGDELSNADWAVANGVLIAATGDMINATESLADSFLLITGNANGDWLLAATTNNPNTSLDSVMLFNGVEVCREGDPVDVDGNGMFDDNAEIASFQANDARLTEDGVVYFLATLRDSSAVALGDAFIRLNLCGSAMAYGTGCAGSGGFVPSVHLTGCAGSGGQVTFEVAGGLGGATALIFYGLSQAATSLPGGCTLNLVPLPLSTVLPLGGVGAGQGSISISTSIPPISASAILDLQVFVLDAGVPQGFSNTNGLELNILK